MIDRLHDWLRRTGAVFRLPHHTDTLRHTSHGIHLTYFGAAFIEGHGLYAIIAGVLVVVGIANYFLHFE